MDDETSFRTFSDFYTFYLGEHTNRTCRRLHFAGTSIAVSLLIAAGVTLQWWFVVVALVQGYAFAWAGHFSSSTIGRRHSNTRSSASWATGAYGGKSSSAECGFRILEHLFYRRHFLWLTGFSGAVMLASQWRLPIDLSLAFAGYGALHALTLSLSARARRRVWKDCAFIAVAAALSLITFHAAVFGRQLGPGLTSGAGTYVLLGLSSMLGALAYGICIRTFKILPLSLPALAAICAACALASCIALFSRSYFHFAGLWWLAVPWWYAFSGGLWCSERRRHGEEAGSGASIV